MERNRGRTGARLLHSHARGLHELVAVPAILVYEIGRDGRVVSGLLYSTPTRRVGRLSVRRGISLRPVVFYELFHRDLKSASMTSFVVTVECLISAVSTIEFSKYTLEWYNGEVGKRQLIVALRHWPNRRTRNTAIHKVERVKTKAKQAGRRSTQDGEHEYRHRDACS